MQKPVAALTATLIGVTVIIASLAMVRLNSDPTTAGAVGINDPQFKPGLMPAAMADLTDQLTPAAKEYSQLLSLWQDRQAYWRDARSELHNSLEQLRSDLGRQLDQDTLSGQLLLDQLELLTVEDLEINRLSWLGRIERAVKQLKLEGVDMEMANMRDQASLCLTRRHAVGAMQMKLNRSARTVEALARRLESAAADLADQAAAGQDSKQLTRLIAYWRWAGRVADRCDRLQIKASSPVKIEDIQGRIQRMQLLSQLLAGPTEAL